MSENQTIVDSTELKDTCISLFVGMLSHGNSNIRCAAAQALGRCAQCFRDGRIAAEIAQQCFDKVKTARDAYSRTGHSFTLGCLNRHAGSLGSSQHLNTTISILLALSQDNASPIVQAWALQSLTLIADSGGPMFRSYVEPSLSQSQRLLMNAPSSHTDVYQCIGKLLAAIITTVGPELQANSSAAAAIRSSLLLNCAIMQEHGDPLVKAQAISCLQQLHMFAPRCVDLASLVPILCEVLISEHLFLRRAAVACLHQLSQREAEQVFDHASCWIRRSKARPSSTNLKAVLQGDHGIIGILFNMLDRETDYRLRADIQKTIKCFGQTLGTLHLSKWISLCKEVLTASESNSTLASPDKELDTEDPDAGDEASFKAREEISIHSAIPPKWSTKVSAAETLCRIIAACSNCASANIHFDLALARESKSKTSGKEDFLVLHLSDLIRMTFMAATSDSDQLRLEGLKALQVVIDKFSKVSEPEFLGHVILEQYQAQVGAALRPAFSTDTPSHVTAMACQVCSAWIGSGVARDLNDLRRVHQLLVSSLAKLHKDSSSRQYNEGASTLEKLSILKAWAEVYVVAMANETSLTNVKHSNDEHEETVSSNESLLQLVLPELRPLSNYWFSALKDHALLTLPAEFSSQLPHDGGAFYTADTVEMSRPRYRDSWPQIVHAAALWLCSNDFKLFTDEKSDTKVSIDNFHLLFGICMEALCNPKSTDPLSNVIACLRSLGTIFDHPLPRSIIASDKHLSVELCSVLHRLLITRENASCQLLVIEIAHKIAKSAAENMSNEKKKLMKEIAPANQKPDDIDASNAFASIGEGGESGEIIPGQSLTFSLLEICMCILVRQLPELSPVLTESASSSEAPPSGRRIDRVLSEESTELISLALHLASSLPELGSPKSSITILPSVLFLITGVLRETSSNYIGNMSNRRPLNAVLES